MMRAFFKSFLYAWNGIVMALREQRNLRIHFAATVLVILAGLYFSVTATEWCILLLCIALVISIELINSSIEDLVNLVTAEWKPQAGKIKDIAAGAVLVMAIIALIVGIIIFYPYIT
jgi:diacylglycerol kinase